MNCNKYLFLTFLLNQDEFGSNCAADKHTKISGYNIGGNLHIGRY